MNSVACVRTSNDVQRLLNLGEPWMRFRFCRSKIADQPRRESASRQSFGAPISPWRKFCRRGIVCNSNYFCVDRISKERDGMVLNIVAKQKTRRRIRWGLVFRQWPAFVLDGTNQLNKFHWNWIAGHSRPPVELRFRRHIAAHDFGLSRSTRWA
jgi:hypothetical protein